MADLYTSYETSVALRDVGAPQEGGDRDWAEQEGTNPMLVKADCFLLPGEVRGPRAFRADEIIEALGDRLATIVRYREPEEYRVVLADELGSSLAYSLVDALAKAWLAVLKEGKK